ncbi:uncharacterized protein LOC106063671 isoform X2 [Biomphalaria glabrata]|nr:uncharacterized protein LOC106063671 isoform X2 [Biomphalaria glabrata]
MASPSRPYLNGPASGFINNGFGNSLSPQGPMGNRRHSEGDLLEMSSNGPRFNKKPPPSTSRQVMRQGSNDGRSPRRKSYAGMEGDIDAASVVSAKSRNSVGSEDSLTSASQLANRRKSESSVMPISKTSSTASLVHGDQRRKSSAPSVANSDRRSSVANGVDSPKPAQERRLSTLSLTGINTGASPFTNIEIPIDLLDSTQSKLRKLMTPIILLFIVIVIVVSLSVAIYFAVVLKETQDKQIEFLRASLQLQIARDKFNRDAEKLSMESIKTDCCKQVDGFYVTSDLVNEFRGCEVSELQRTRMGLSLYFLNTTSINEDRIMNVLAQRSTPENQSIEINGFDVSLSKESRDVSLNFVKKPESFYGIHSPELKPLDTARSNGPVTLASVLDVPQTIVTTTTWASTPTTTAKVTPSSTPLTLPVLSMVLLSQSPAATEMSSALEPTTTYSVSTDAVSTSPAQTTPLTSTSNIATTQLSVEATTSTMTVTTKTIAVTTKSSPMTTTTTSAATPAAIASTTTATAEAGSAMTTVSSFSTTTAEKATAISTTTLSAQELNKLCQDNSDLSILTHPSSCTDFIQCEFNQAKTQPCPPGLVFNNTFNQCVLPDANSSCLPKPCANLNGGYHANPLNCSQYIVCEFGKPVVASCQEALVWNQEVKNCVTRNDTFQCNSHGIG